MIHEFIHIQIKSSEFNAETLNKDTWLVLLYTNRIPPHIGFMVNGNYNSLTIKGTELDVDIKLILKIISQKNIESVFIKLRKHPVFSTEYQLKIFQEYAKGLKQVKSFDTTCLTPIKLFFEEFYAIPFQKNELLFDFIKRLNDNAYIDYISSINCNFKENTITLPLYSLNELNQKISKEELI